MRVRGTRLTRPPAVLCGQGYSERQTARPPSTSASESMPTPVDGGRLEDVKVEWERGSSTGSVPPLSFATTSGSQGGPTSSTSGNHNNSSTNNSDPALRIFASLGQQLQNRLLASICDEQDSKIKEQDQIIANLQRQLRSSSIQAPAYHQNNDTANGSILTPRTDLGRSQLDFEGYDIGGSNSNVSSSSSHHRPPQRSFATHSRAPSLPREGSSRDHEAGSPWHTLPSSHSNFGQNWSPNQVQAGHESCNGRLVNRSLGPPPHYGPQREIAAERGHSLHEVHGRAREEGRRDTTAYATAHSRNFTNSSSSTLISASAFTTAPPPPSSSKVSYKPASHVRQFEGSPRRQECAAPPILHQQPLKVPHGPKGKARSEMGPALPTSSHSTNEASKRKVDADQDDHRDTKRVKAKPTQKKEKVLAAASDAGIPVEKHRQQPEPLRTLPKCPICDRNMDKPFAKPDTPRGSNLRVRLPLNTQTVYVGRKDPKWKDEEYTVTCCNLCSVMVKQCE